LIFFVVLRLVHSILNHFSFFYRPRLFFFKKKEVHVKFFQVNN
jgi:hypothetical protein